MILKNQAGEPCIHDACVCEWTLERQQLRELIQAVDRYFMNPEIVGGRLLVVPNELAMMVRAVSESVKA